VYVVLNVRPLTVIGEVPVPVMLPGKDVAVYVIAPAPKSVGGVKVTVAVLELAAVAVSIVGSLGTLGHVPAATDCIIDCNAHDPVAAEIDVVGGVADMTAPL
jgi:hypothetical protein